MDYIFLLIQSMEYLLFKIEKSKEGLAKIVGTPNYFWNIQRLR